MDVALISILSGSSSVVSAGGEGSSNESPLNSQPFGELMASVAQGAGPTSEAMIDNAIVGQMIDQVPTVLLHQDNTDALAELAQNQELIVTSSDIAALAVGAVGEQEVGHSAATMLAPLDMEPVAWSVEQPKVIEIVEAGVAAEVNTATGIIASVETVLRALPADEALPQIILEGESVDAELLEEVDQLIGAAQADVIEITEVTADEVVTPLVAVQENTQPIAPTSQPTSVSPAEPVLAATPAIPAAAQAQAHQATPTAPAVPAAPTEATPDADAELDAVIERVLSQSSKAPANQNSANQNIAQPASHSIAADFAKVVAQPDTIDKVDILQPQTSGMSHTISHEGADRFASLTVLKSEPLFQGRPATPSEQVQVTIRQAMQSGLDRVVIELDPADLGRVEVRMEMAKEGRVQVVVIADNRDTLDQLKQDARDLQRALQDAGLDANAGDMEFQLGRDQSEDADDDELAGAYGDAVDDARVPDESYMDPLTGHYTVMVNEGLDIKV